MAAALYAGNPDAQIAGLLLWARDTFDAARGQLPDDAVIVGLAGVNHAQFGDHGTQVGDGPAAISDDAARVQIVEASSALVSRVSSEG